MTSPSAPTRDRMPAWASAGNNRLPPLSSGGPRHRASAPRQRSGYAGIAWRTRGHRPGSARCRRLGRHRCQIAFGSGSRADRRRRNASIAGRIGGTGPSTSHGGTGRRANHRRGPARASATACTPSARAPKSPCSSTRNGCAPVSIGSSRASCARRCRWYSERASALRSTRFRPARSRAVICSTIYRRAASRSC